MNTQAMKSHVLYIIGVGVDLALRLRENDHLGVARPHYVAQDLAQPSLLLMLVQHLHMLRDLRVGRQLGRPDRDVNVLRDEVLRQLAHLLRPRGAEHGRLPVRPNLLDDLADLRLEAHVQHAVGLVQHQECAAAKGNGALLQKVK